MYFRCWLGDYILRDKITAKDPFGANKTRLKQLRSEGWISQIPPRLRSSAFSIRVESINFNFSSQSIIYFPYIPISLSSLEVIYFEKLQKIQIVERGVTFQLNQFIMYFICLPLIPLGTWIFSWCKILVCMPGFPADISCHWNDWTL